MHRPCNRGDDFFGLAIVLPTEIRHCDAPVETLKQNMPLRRNRCPHLSQGTFNGVVQGRSLKRLQEASAEIESINSGMVNATGDARRSPQ